MNLCRKKKALERKPGPGEDPQIVDGWDKKYVDFGEDAHSTVDPKKRVVALKPCHLVSHQSAMRKFSESNIARDFEMQDLTAQFAQVASPSSS